MKATGIVRKIDALGRVVLPIDIRKKFKWNIKDTLEIFAEDNKVILKKYEPACVFCGAEKDVENFKDRNICKKCIRELSTYTKIKPTETNWISNGTKTIASKCLGNGISTYVN